MVVSELRAVVATNFSKNTSSSEIDSPDSIFQNRTG